MSERYSPTEAKLALARTAELQVARERSTAGLTRDELARIAADTGLDAELLERALEELEASRVESSVEHRWGSTVVRCELRRPLDEREREELASRLAHEHGEPGRWERASTGEAGAHTWRSRSLVLTVRPTARGDLLRLEARKRWSVLALAVGVPAASAAIALAVRAAFSWKWGIDSIAAAVFLAGLVIGGGLVSWLDGQRSRATAARLVALLERTVRRLPAADGSNSAAPRALREGG